MAVAFFRRYAFVVLILSVVAFPAFGDDVTISGNVQFYALDGSSLDHDGAANGTFTVDDGNLTVLGAIHCNDDAGPANNSACPMRFVVSGNFLIDSGGALYAENRRGGGSGGAITIETGGNVTVNGINLPRLGGIISTSRTSNGNPQSSRAGFITINAGGSVNLGVASLITAASSSAIPTRIEITSEDDATLNGLVLAGPSSLVNLLSLYTGEVLAGGSSLSAGADIVIEANGNGQPSVTIGGTAVIATQSESSAPGHVEIEGCDVTIRGLVAALADTTTGASVTVRSATTVLVDGRDLFALAIERRGMLRADSTLSNAGGHSANVYAPGGIQVLGPPNGPLYVVNSNGGITSNDSSGTINVMSTGSTVTASGRAFSASNNNSGDQGGTINVSASSDVNLDNASLDASGDFTTNNNNRKGGAINVRSYSGAVSWNNGTGDVRPTGSNVPAARRGTITVTHCTGYTAAGATFPTNGSPVGPFPTVVQTCSPASPSLPPGESHPDCNDPPVAANDAYTVPEGGTLNVPAPGVLANDSDPDGDPMTAVLVSGPANASSFTLNADGSFNYVHNGGETTSDSFTYRASATGVTSNVATVSITITPVNDAPFANNDSYTVAEGGTINLVAPGVLANDSDPDGPAMTAVLVSGPAHASSFTLNPDGSFIYVHDGGESTSDSFTYRASDGTLQSNLATVSITITPVNDAPVANNDAYTVAEGGTLNVPAPGVLGNDSDPDSSLTAVLVTGPANASSFTLNADGSFNYVHNGSETTSDSFTYKANDGSVDSNVATVAITITPTNDAPVAVDDAYSVNEGGTLTVPAPGVLGNDTDVEGNAFSAVLVSGPANASSFTLNADGSFTYVHNGSETTTDSFTYKANDGSDSNVATVTITITPVNDAPVANNDAYSVDEGASLVIAAPGVLGNDTDAENNPLTAVLVSGPAHASSFTFNPDGSFTYAHDGSETASDSFTYKANDGSLDSNTATVTITINPVNDAPVAVNDAYSTNFNATLNVPAPGVLGNDTDVDSPTLNAVLVTPPTQGNLTLNPDGSFTYVHTGATTGTDAFTYRANDGSADSNIATVTITIIAAPPVAVDDAYTTVGNTELRVGLPPGATPHVLVSGDVLDNDTDVDTPNGALTVNSFDATSANGGSVSMDPQGRFTYLPPVGNTSSDSFNYVVTDGTSSDTGTVAITFTGRVWYVNAAYGGSSTGRSTEPFTTLPQAEIASAITDYIHVAAGSYGTGITLKNGQRLVGSGVPLVVGAFVLAPATARPTLGGTVTLASANVATGFNVNAGGAGISGSGITGGAISFVGVTSGGNGLTLASSSGSFIFNDITLATTAGGLVLTGGSPAVTVANLDATTTTGAALSGNAGSLTLTAGADGSTLTTSAGGVVDLSNMALDVTLLSASSTGGTNGIRLASTTGSFTITGAGTTSGSGGSVANATSRGASFIGAANVSLANMTFTGNGTVNGDAAVVCGDILNGTNLNCAAGIHLVNVTGVALTNVAVSGGVQIGVNGNGVSNLSMSSVSVTNAGNEVNEHGVQFFNLSGASSVTNSAFTGNAARQFAVQNVAASGTLAINTGIFTGTGSPLTGSDALYAGARLSASISVDAQSSSFTNNFSAGVHTDALDSGSVALTVNGGTFTSNGIGIVAATSNSASSTFTLTNNVLTGTVGNVIGITKVGGTATGTITGNTIGAPGVPGSGCTAPSCFGIDFTGTGGGLISATVHNNTVRNFDGRGISASGQQGSGTMNVTISNNVIAEPSAAAINGIFAQSGALPADTTSVCADIFGNSISGTYSSTMIRVRNRFAGTSFRLPNFAGAGNNVAQVAAFLAGQNSGASSSATVSTNPFTGGAGNCGTP
jgi:VCBS repeat-containing protein